MVKLSLDERLNQIEKKISDQSFLHNKGLGNEVGYYIFDYDPREELHVRNHIQYLKKRINESSLGFQIIELDLFHLMIEVLRRKVIWKHSLIWKERMDFLRWQTV